VGWKSLAVNLSDIASMGGRPRWALVALACPESVTTDEAAAFWAGALDLAAEHAVAVVGGDTAASPHGWAVNVTVLGEAVRPPLLRSTARPGDVIAVTGVLGRSAAGLALLPACGRSDPEAPAGPDIRCLARRNGLALLLAAPSADRSRWFIAEWVSLRP